MFVQTMIRRGEAHEYSVELLSNQYARIEARQQEIDLNVSVRGPHKEEVVAMTGTGCGTARVSFVAASSGLFKVLVRADNDSTDRGRYELRLSVLRPSRADDQREVRAHELFEEASLNAGASKERIEDSISFARKAASLWSEASDHVRSAQAMVLAGALSARRGHWEDARNGFSEAVRLYGEAGDRVGHLTALGGLARLEGHFSIRTQEIPTDEEFLKLWRTTGDRRGVAQSISAMAGAHAQAGRFREALDLEQQALRLRKAVGDHEGEIRSMEHLLAFDVNLGNLSQATLLAQEIFRRRQTGDPRGVAAALGNLAWLSDLNGDSTRAVDFYRRMSAIHHAAGDLSAEAAVHRNLGAVLLRMNKTDEALVELHMAETLEETIEKDLHSPVWKTGYAAKTSLGASIIDTLWAAHQKDPQKGYERQAFSEVDHAYGLYLQDGGSRRLSIEDIQSVLDNDSVLLEYWLGSERAWLWRVSREGFAVYDIGTRKEIEDLSKRANDGLVARSDLRDEPVEKMRRRLLASDQEASVTIRKLSRRLLLPVAGYLGRRRILIVCDGVLHRVPFSLLSDPSLQGDTPLVAHHEVVYLPYAGVLTAAPASRTSQPWFTIIADPLSHDHVEPGDVQRAVRAVGLGVQIPRLQYAWQEVQDISRQAPARYTRRLIGQSANRRALLDGALSDSTYIHFVAHGFVNPEDPELSGLLLSKLPGGNDDGFFRLSDVQKLRLSAELVVLSACRTARGAEPPYGGVVSLTSGFLRAGASQVLSTSWKVDDEATAAFMKLFYEKLLGQGQTAAQALREAQLAMAATERWKTPYYWGGFLLYQGRGNF